MFRNRLKKYYFVSIFYCQRLKYKLYRVQKTPETRFEICIFRRIIFFYFFRALYPFEGSHSIPAIWWDQAKQLRATTKGKKVAKAKRPVQNSETAETERSQEKRPCLPPNTGVTLVCDRREICGNGKSKSQLKSILEKISKFEVTFLTLNISDFCFCVDSKIAVLLERKRKVSKIDRFLSIFTV